MTATLLAAEPESPAIVDVQTPARPVCRCCGVRKANRPRGLCWSCHRRPDSRERFPTASKFARRGVLDTYARRPLPVPTTALPGTPEKLAVLAARAAARQSLFHPDDPPFEPVAAPLEVPCCRVLFRTSAQRSNRQ